MSTIKADTLSNLAGTQTIPVSTVAQGSAKAWVSFNGTGTVAIRDSFNVSSITDNGTGDYTVNFTTAMPDNNYAAFIAGFNAFGNFNVITAFGSGYNVGSVVVLTGVSSPATAADFPLVNVSVFR